MKLFFNPINIRQGVHAMITNDESSLPQSSELRPLQERNPVELVNGVPVEAGQYAALLLDFKRLGAVPDKIKRIWKTLYFASGPMLTDEIAKELGEKGIGSVNLIFGKFSGRFYRAFKKRFPYPPKIKEGAGKENGENSVYTEMFAELEDNGQVYFTLRKGFGAALEAVYGDEMLNW